MTTWGPENDILKKYLNYESFWKLMYEIEYDKKPKMLLNYYQINIRNKKYNKKIKKFRKLPNEIVKNIFSFVEDDYIIGYFNFICKKYKHRWLNILEYLYYNGFDQNRVDGLVGLIESAPSLPISLDRLNFVESKDIVEKRRYQEYIEDEEDEEDEEEIFDEELAEELAEARAYAEEEKKYNDEELNSNCSYSSIFTSSESEMEEYDYNNSNLLAKYGYLKEYVEIHSYQLYTYSDDSESNPKGLVRDFINKIKNLKNIDQRLYFEVIYYIINKYKSTIIIESKFESVIKKLNNKEYLTKDEWNLKGKCSAEGDYCYLDNGYYFFVNKYAYNKTYILDDLKFKWNDHVM